MKPRYWAPAGCPLIARYYLGRTLFVQRNLGRPEATRYSVGGNQSEADQLPDTAKELWDHAEIVARKGGAR